MPRKEKKERKKETDQVCEYMGFDKCARKKKLTKKRERMKTMYHKHNFSYTVT